MVKRFANLRMNKPNTLRIRKKQSKVILVWIMIGDMPELIKNLAYSSSRNTNAPQKDKSVSRHMIAKQTKGNKTNLKQTKKSVV